MQRYERGWHFAPPAGRKFALCWPVGADIPSIGQYEPTCGMWIIPVVGGSPAAVPPKDVGWVPLPDPHPSIGVDADPRVFALPYRKGEG